MTKKVNRPHKKTGPKGPTKMTEETLRKLENGAKYAFNDKELCLHAGISKTSYYDYLKNNPDFSDRIDILRNSPTLKAKLNLVDSIEAGDMEDSKWRLERKNRKEFAKQDNIELSGPDGGPLVITEKQMSAVASLKQRIGKNSKISE